MSKRTLILSVLVVALVAAFLIVPEALAGKMACGKRNNNTFKKLLACVTVEGVREHQAVFQAIADANGGTRVAGSSGYDQSVDYVSGKLEAAGYEVTVQPFQFNAFLRLGPSTLEQTSPEPTVYLEGVDYLLVNYSAPGDVTAPVTAVDLELGLGNTSTSGCEAADFAGFPAGNIALIQRGDCSFQLKAENAAAAGAVGVILFNQGDADGRFDAIESTLSPGYIGGIPVHFVSYYMGEAWAATPGLEMHMVADVFLGEMTTYNLLAETRGGNPDNVVMVGASLDSVSNGPGIQSNGAGSAAVLEVALQMAKVKPRNKVRFAWWGAEESGILGSFHYVGALSPEELDSIALYLNFDTIASPNYVYYIYDGDDSDGSGVGPGAEGSAEIEKVFEAYYTMVGQPFKGVPLYLPSDYYPFNLEGIPVGGIYTGDVGIKTVDEAALWGGTAGEQYDPCYHLACDTFDNVSLEALDINSDAAAYAVLQFAMSTEDINGVKGKGNFRLDDVFVEAVR